MILKNFIKPHILLLIICTISYFNIRAESKELDSLLQLSYIAENDTGKVVLLNQIAGIYLEDNFINALKYSKKALLLAQHLNYDNGILESLTNLSDANDYLGRYSEAQKLNFQILSIYETHNDVEGINSTYNNIGIIHYYLNNYSQAIKFTEKALKYYESQKDSNGMSICYNNLANSYSDQLNYKKALEYYFKALKLDEAKKDMEGVSLIKGNIGEVYTELNEPDSAYTFLISALQIAEKTKDRWQQSTILNALGDLLSRQNKPQEALDFLLRALDITRDIGAKAETAELYQSISKVLEQKGDYLQSLHYLKLTNEINNELYNKENASKIAEMNALYEIKEKDKELLKQEAVAAYQKSQKMMIITGASIGFILLLIIVIISVRGNISKRKVNHTLELQKQQIEMKNRDITDSIQYAKRIQAAILPSDKLIHRHLNDSFVLYMPKDIVAGDFYWMETVSSHKKELKKDNSNPSKSVQEEHLVLFAVADCTGHGVPGAMVSVVCNNALNRAVREFGLIKPSDILDKVRDIVIETFEKSDTNIKDGMDIALCSLNLKTNELEYAGANNSLYLIRNEELVEIKSDKQPIGKFMNNKPFTNHSEKVLKGDKIYLFTDGYADQFGGKKGKKFKYKQFQELIFRNRNNSMNEQLNALITSFNDWKGDLEQIDDVCVIGVKI